MNRKIEKQLREEYENQEIDMACVILNKTNSVPFIKKVSWKSLFSTFEEYVKYKKR